MSPTDDPRCRLSRDRFHLEETMSDIVLASLLVSVGPTLAALGGVWLAIVNGRTLGLVHTNTNSTLTKLTEDNAVLRKQVQALEDLIRSLALKPVGGKEGT